MIKSILVCTDGSEYGDIACDYAINLTQKLEARLLGLHVLDSRMLEGPLMADISGWVGAQPYGKQLQQFRELMEQKGEAIINALNDKCEKAGIKAETWIKMGHPAHMILEEEARAELLVIGQKGEHAEFIEGMIGSSLDRVIRRSSNPCLVTPGAFKPISRLLVAYDGSGHAGQALREASELAAALKLEMTILTVTEGLSPEKAAEVSKDGVALAEDHGLEPKALVLDGDAEHVILETADSEGCDMIVVGAYGHSRIRELIVGSTTHYLVARSEIPVLLVR
jgi:nucleotide-binding universal stress UspA family protein